MDEYSLEKKSNEVIINEQAEKHVEEMRQTSNDVFSQDRLKLNHETDLKDKKEKFSSRQHDEKKTELEEEAKNLTDKLTKLSDVNIQGFEHFNERRKMQEQVFADKIGALDHDYKWYSKDSTYMVAVKKSLREVVNVMNMKVKDERGALIDATIIRETVLGKYNAATKACDEYIKNAGANYSTGKRRLKMVDEIRGMLQGEIQTLEVVIDAMANGDIAAENVNKVGDLFWNLKSEPVEKAEWQKEGNSTDVYLVDIKSEDGEKKKQYYVKENLKMISDDLPGYLSRRIRQVSNSKKAFDSDDSKDQQEERLKEGNLSGADYENGLKVLKLLQKKLDDASGKDKIKVRERILQFLGHDFDNFFKEYEAYNANVQLFNDNAKGRAELLKKLEKNEDENSAIIKAIKDSIEKNKNTTMKKLTQIEYLKERVKAKDFVGLDLKKDKDVFKALTELSKAGKNSLKTFFTRTLGKEVELYGQQCERSGGTTGITENEILASNNIATGRIAKRFGFNNEIAGSRLMVMNFKRKGEEKSQDINCTVIDPAEGDEMLELVKRAENEGLKIHYSPNAVRQLIRLQMFDTVCMQTDRHWRNFKCTYEVDDKTKKLTIKTIKSYDHDMSFGKTFLKEAFTNKDTKKRINKNGMLPSLMAEIKADSPEYAYLANKTLVTTGPDFLRFVETPDSSNERYGEDLKGHDEVMITPYINVGKVGYAATLLGQYKRIGGKYSQSLMDAVSSLRKKDGTKLKEENDEYLAEPQQELAEALCCIYENTIFDIEKTSSFYNIVTSTKTTSYFADLTVVDKLDEGIKKTYIKDEKGEVINAEYQISKETLGKIMQSLKCINDILRDYTIDNSIFDIRLRFMLYYFKLNFENDSKAKEAYIEAEKQENGEDATSLIVEVPTMLHMDEEAYESLVEMTKSDEAIEFAVKDLNWEPKKIDAFKTRIRETIGEIKRMREKAEEYLHRVYKEDDVRYNFFLKADAYDKIEDIKDIVWNPSLSYLGIEDPNYLYGDKNFKQVTGITEEQEKKAKTETNALRNGQRQRLGDMQGEYHSIVESSISK